MRTIHPREYFFKSLTYAFLWYHIVFCRTIANQRVLFRIYSGCTRQFIPEQVQQIHLHKTWIHIIVYKPMVYAEILHDHHPLLVRILKLSIPVAIAIIQLVLLSYFIDPGSFLIILGLMTAYVLPPAGKETVIPAGIALGIPWWLIAVSIMMIDIETALFMGWNFEIGLKLPLLGSIMESVIQKTREFIRENPWIKKLYFTGIVILVMMPVLGSGGIRGSIIGQLLGMEKKQVFLAIITGAFIGCFGIALGTLFLQGLFLQSFLLGIITLAVLIVVLISGWYYWKFYHKRSLPKKTV